MSVADTVVDLASGMPETTSSSLLSDESEESPSSFYARILKIVSNDSFGIRVKPPLPFIANY